MPGAPFLALRLDSLENRGSTGAANDAGRCFVCPTLVADRAAGVQRVGQDFGESRFGQPELVGDLETSRVALATGLGQTAADLTPISTGRGRNRVVCSGPGIASPRMAAAYIRYPHPHGRLS